MSFFKKNKSKSKKADQAKKLAKSDIEKEINKMDRERHLDLQLEELNARLNIKDEANDAITASQSNDIKTDPVELDNTEFLTGSLKGFVSPNFSTTLTEKTKSIDVTAPTDTNDTPVNNIDMLLTEAHEVTDSKTKEDAIIAEVNTEDMTIPVSDDELPSIETDISLSSPNRLDVSAMRMDVAKISSDIQNGEEIYRRALQRVEGLMSSVEKAEVDFSVLNRLEPENRRLKAKLRTTQGEAETIKGKLTLITADLEDHQNRLSEKTSQYEKARSKLVAAANSLQEYERVLKSKKTESERYALAVERHKTALSVEARENKVLREKIGEFSSAQEMRQAEYLEASKAVESLRSDCADLRDQADTFRTEAQDLRIALNTARRQNNAMKSEMQTLHEDIKTFKTQYEFNVINREDQVIDLEAQIAFLAKEIDTKTELAQSATKDVAALRSIRNEQDIERDRLEKKLAAANDEIKDIMVLSQSRNSEKINAFETEVRDLQAEIVNRDDIAKQTAKETSDLQRQHTALGMECERLQSRLDMQTQQLETAVINNPANELKNQIHHLTEQLRIKDDIVKSAAQDVQKLREDRKNQLLKQKQLEDLIHTQTFQLEAAHKTILESKETETELDQKYKNVAAALSVNQARRRSEGRTENPDIKPDISDEFDNLSGEDVEDRILDYKFGIRKDIV